MLSVVMPAYNESEIIEGSVRAWHEGVVAKVPGAELIVIDDCSTDDTFTILSRLAAELPGVRLIRSSVNEGHGPALVKGLRAAAKEFVFFTDSDRQFPVDEFWTLWDRRGGRDFVFGVRINRIDGPFRQAISACVRLLIRTLWGLRVSDANCAFKLMRRPPLLEILGRIPAGSMIPIILLSIMVYDRGASLAEVPVTHLPRPGGTPSLTGVGKWARLIARCAGEMLRLRWSGRESARRLAA